MYRHYLRYFIQVHVQYLHRHKCHYSLLLLFISCHYYVLQIRIRSNPNFMVRSDRYHAEKSFRIRIRFKDEIRLFLHKEFCNLYVKIVQFLFDYINAFRYLEQLLNAFNVLLQSHVMSTSKIFQLLGLQSEGRIQILSEKGLESRIRIRTKSFRIHNIAFSYRYMNTARFTVCDYVHCTVNSWSVFFRLALKPKQ